MYGKKSSKKSIVPSTPAEETGMAGREQTWGLPSRVTPLLLRQQFARPPLSKGGSNNKTYRQVF